MNIGDNGFDAGGHDNLLERMQRAHAREAEATGGVDSESSFAAGLGGADKANGASGSKDPQLEKELLATASAALEGKFDGADEVRGAVVETIVDTRYGEGMAKSERSRVVSTLKQTLIDDQEFRAEVDNMLILAARELARS